MRKSLLATVAAAALIAGTGVVAAQGAKEPATKAGQAEMNNGASTKGAEMNGHARTTGSGANEMKSEPKAEMKGHTQTNGHARTTGSGANEPKAESRTDEPKAGTKAHEEMKGRSGHKNEMKSERSKASTTGAGSSEQNKASESKSGRGANEMKSGAEPKSSAQGTSHSTTAQGASGSQGASVNLTTEQRTKIRTTVLESKSAPKISRSSINFDINVGTTVPRSVHFATLPTTIVEIHPAWRGYEYFVVEDQVIVVDPHTLRIVAVLDV